ncbi:glycosyltransferase family 4 protein [Dysgonomonas sp. ZJ709]|uniref:glycosyltransferase family 4 protein n=1 Tax=Dysgonomonas sp. ZJ709 TaxID=2709797 RepID=UPI0013EB9FD9|nr:glycosyltransferase family 4 protein [Dysgonomonas sp. ZJ709]
MNILITAPSLDVSKNVSGIAAVVTTILSNNKDHSYYHYLLGRPDIVNDFFWLFRLLNQLVLFPFALKKNKIDLVHQNLPLNAKGISREYIINLWCRVAKIPVFLHVHGGAFLTEGTVNIFYRRIIKSLFKHSDKVIVLSDLEKESLDRLYDYNSAVVLCNSIDSKVYKASERYITDQVPIILYLGRIHRSKGVEDIVNAFRHLKGKIRFKFYLCGTGPLKQYFIDSCKEILQADFEYYGVVSGKMKVDLIKEAHVFLLPSRYGEGLPMALLETMAAGVVPIVTDDASMKYVIQHEINGIIVRKESPLDISEKINQLFSDDSLYQSISEKASETVTNYYDISAYIIRLNILYASIFEVKVN